MKTVQEYINEASPPMVTDSMEKASKLLKEAINELNVASGKHADRSDKMKANKAKKIIKEAEKVLK